MTVLPLFTPPDKSDVRIGDFILMGHDGNGIAVYHLVLRSLHDQHRCIGLIDAFRSRQVGRTTEEHFLIDPDIRIFHMAEQPHIVLHPVHDDLHR